MAEVSLGNLSHGLGDSQEQRSVGDYVSGYSTPSLPVLPEVRAKDRVQETLRAVEEPRPKCSQVSVADARHQSQ